ncbi:hypothetical protein ARALYDRAFT_896717 [Arabidopsis lyrata subsp. lyrata]|uniref:Trichome birefringence-like C-terminal domain-containing protein n=1 Tax=Arabidopsis lyrata subsp. lyrata TaxID=81972 RepID=D7L4S0_ARALL|nr:hypothetical protein ARALYDRAFT_896717 [Arabidopsis lyrata subsp. lyrata]
MAAQRKDGHPSLYYHGPLGPAPLHRQDCSHWCLPGVPDTWNELFYALFMKQEAPCFRLYYWALSPSSSCFRLRKETENRLFLVS